MAASRLECSICIDVFKDPKLLPCYHSFCLNCLENHVRNNLSNGRFNCPLCRQSVELPNGGVSAFQANFYVDSNPSEQTVCDQHKEKEITLYCQDCKALICDRCIAVSHDRHVIQHVSNAAAEVKNNIKIKMNECLNKVRRLTDSEREAEDLDKKINDAERKEIKALEDQRLQLIKLIDQEVAKMKDKITNVYEGLRQQNAVLKRQIKEELKTCSTAYDNARHMIDHEKDMDITKKGSDIEQWLAIAMIETVKTNMTRLEKDLFSPVKLKVRELIPLIGMMRDSTELSLEEKEKKEREEREKKEREEKEKKEREIKQIQTFRSIWPNTRWSDEELIQKMCPNCQGWIVNRDVGFKCKCGGTA